MPNDLTTNDLTTSQNFSDQVLEVIKREGGFVNHPADRGGATKYGITITTLQEWRKKDVSIGDVGSLTVEEASEIYISNYYKKPGFSNFKDSKLQILLFDTAVHSGTAAATKMLQRAVGVKDDGIIGAITIQTVNLVPDSGLLRRKFLGQRFRYIGNILTKDHEQAVFAAGWINRISGLLERYG